MNSHFSVPERDLREMTVAELDQWKRRWYAEADANSYFADFAVVARTLGKNTDARFIKYQWEENGIRLYHDIYGGYMTVHVNDRQVCSTHSGDRFITPGEWIDVIRAHANEARLKEQATKAVDDEGQRARLLAQLGADR